MKLKTTSFITAFVCFLIITIAGYTGAKEPDPSSQAIFEQTTFEFSPVIAGTDVTHLFSIINKGNAPLHIPGVYVK